MFCIKEPKRQIKNIVGKLKEKKEATPEQGEEEQATFAKLFANPVNRLILMAAFLANLGESINIYYLPIFFLKNFPAQKAIFSQINALSMSVMGMVSGIAAGIVSDTLEKRGVLRIKAWICTTGALLALPLMALTTLQTSNFWLSIICQCIQTFTIAHLPGMAITHM